eukprot:gene7050-8407_t
MADTLSTEDISELIITIVKNPPEGVKPPIHVAQVAQLFKKKTGKQIKEYHKYGMLNFISKHLTSELIVLGEGKDAFVRLATPTAVAIHWIRICVFEHGPILISMIGRLYREEHDKHFNEGFPMGLTKFVQEYLSKEMSLENQKGQEYLVDLIDRSSRFFTTSKKKRKATEAKILDTEKAFTLKERLLAAPEDIPFRHTDRVLVLGDADFSWSASLACFFQPQPAENLVGTAFESFASLKKKYDTFQGNKQALEKCGATCLDSVDATRLHATELGGSFDFIVFNFPHTGTDEGLDHSIQENQQLVQRFLASAPALLKPDGEVIVTLIRRYPYTAWKIKEQTSPGLQYMGAVLFDPAVYQGYKHQATTQIDRDT